MPTSCGIGVVLFLSAVAMPIAQQPQGAASTPAASDATLCAQAQAAIARTMDAAMARLESARQANTTADLRAAVDDMQALLRDLRRQLEPCATLPLAAANRPGAQPPAKPASEVIDPVCGMKVDPRMAPKATHAGKTYYFCTEDDRQMFVKTPSTYVK